MFVDQEGVSGSNPIWHADGTAGEDDDNSHLAATVPSSAGGEAYPR
jgi:hypothetical protein